MNKSQLHDACKPTSRRLYRETCTPVDRLVACEYDRGEGGALEKNSSDENCF